MTDNNIRGITKNVKSKKQKSIDLNIKKMKETFIFNVLKNWKANRSHPIQKSFAAPKKGKQIWDSSGKGTFRNVYKTMSAQEIDLSIELQNRTNN